MKSAVSTDIAVWLIENMSKITPSDISVVPWDLR